MIEILEIIISALVGLYFGAVIAVFIYAAVIKSKIDKNGSTEFANTVSNDERIKVNEIISKHFSPFEKSLKYYVLTKLFGFWKKDKPKRAKINYYNLIYDIAKLYSPSAYNPLLDISETEFFDFLHKIILRIKTVIDASELEILKSVKLSTVLDVEKTVESILGNKAVKTAHKSASVAIKIFNCLNPYYWIRQLTVYLLLIKTFKEIIRYSVIIPAVEFANLYSNVKKEQPTTNVA